MIHNDHHPLALHTVTVTIEGETFPYRVEDYWDRVTGRSWEDSQTSNPAALQYAMRHASSRLPFDNEVLYGKIGNYGHLVHVSEVTDEKPPA